MKVTYTTPNGRLAFEMDAASPKAAFEAVAGIQEVFEERQCGCCKSERIHFEVREFDKKKYFKMVCSDCTAQLDFGQNQDLVNLFPKHRDKDTKQPLPNRGWYIYRGENDHPQQHAAPAQQPAGTADDLEVRKWLDWIRTDPNLKQFNERILADVPKIASEELKKRVWGVIQDHARLVRWVWVTKDKVFVKQNS